MDKIVYVVVCLFDKKKNHLPYGKNLTHFCRKSDLYKSIEIYKICIFY